jgi:hypothetical protein
VGPVIAYALVVVALDRLVASGLLDLDLLASSPAGLLQGRVWTMLSSGLVSAGSAPLLQVALLSGLLVVFAFRYGTRQLWRTALAAHVGSALVAYAALLAVVGIGLGRESPDFTAPDYGISCVWFGCLAALLCATLTERVAKSRSDLAVAAICLAAIVCSHPIVSDALTTAEHLLAIAIGAATALWPRAVRGSAACASS